MNCPKCNELSKKDGKDRNGEQRFKCTACGKRFTLPKEKLLGSDLRARKGSALSAIARGRQLSSFDRTDHRCAP
jgi:transposase-like protein